MSDRLNGQEKLIKQLLEERSSLRSTTGQKQLVGVEEAAKRINLSADRFYQIWPLYFTEYGGGRKKLFDLDELDKYNLRLLPPKIDRVDWSSKMVAKSKIAS